MRRCDMIVNEATIHKCSNEVNTNNCTAYCVQVQTNFRTLIFVSLKELGKRYFW